MAARTVVTISRQLGSGGAEIGRLVASRLEAHYADREILGRAAEALGLEETELSWREERAASIWDRITGLFPYGLPDAPYAAPPIRPIPDEELFALEGRIIKELAGREDCVIVGRGAAWILREYPGATHVLLHAPARARIRRVMEVYHADSRARAIAMIRESDSARRAYLDRVGHHDWLCATNYHLSIDTSVVRPAQAAELIVGFVRLRFGN